MSQNLQLQNTYKINQAQIVEETIDGEVIIINLNKGHYFSMNGTGAEIWSCVKLGMSGNNIISSLKHHYDDPNQLIDFSIKKLLLNLKDEELITIQDNVSGKTKVNSHNTIDKNDNLKKIFVEPKLEKYTDMEDLLLLDPIHDVDEQGWPKMPKQLK